MDIYVSHPDKAMLETFVADPRFVQQAPLVQGRAATPATDDQPESPAIGDPARWYTLVRTEKFEPEVLLPDGTALVDPSVGSQIVGVFS